MLRKTGKLLPCKLSRKKKCLHSIANVGETISINKQNQLTLYIWLRFTPARVPADISDGYKSLVEWEKRADLFESEFKNDEVTAF